jgi:hypothetical protein
MATAREAGIEALKNGDPKAALQHLTEAVRADANDAQAYAYLGTAYGQLSMFDQAAACLTKAVSLAPQSAALRFNLGMALERAGKRAEAVESYRQSLAVDGSYERARQALTRLGESAPAAAPAPAAAATAAAPATAAPAAPAPATPAAPAIAGLADFALGPSEPAAPAAYTDVTLTYAAPGQEPTIATSTPWGASAPTLYGAPAEAPPQNPWTSAPGPQPMGDWTPAPSTGGGLADYQTAPQRPPSTANSYSPAAGAATMTTIEAPEQQMPRSWMLGHCYLSGMSLGVWWGVIGAVVFILNAMLNFTADQMGRMAGVVVVIPLMIVAVGALIYGAVGWIGGQTEEPERTCGNLGIGVGVVTALFLMPLAMSILMVGVGGMFGTIVVSRLFGKSLGGRINDMQASVFVVASSSGVAMVRGR